MSALKVVNIGDPGLATRYGADDLDVLNRILSGEDLGKTLKVTNIFHFAGNNILRILRPNDTNYVSINTEAEAANRSIIVPSLGGDRKMAFSDMPGQTFAEPQTVKKDIEHLLTLFRDTNTEGSRGGLTIDMKDDLGNQTQLAHIQAVLDDNTNTTEDSWISLRYLQGGSISEYVYFWNKGIGFGGSGNEVYLSNANQISNQSFTFPTTSGDLVVKEESPSFLQGMRILDDDSDVLTLYRLSSNTADSLRQRFSHKNSSESETIFSEFKSTMRSNAPGTEYGRFEFFVRRNGLLDGFFKIDAQDNKITFFDYGNHIAINNNNLTGDWDYQLPNSSQTLLGRTETATISGKNIDADQNTITNIENADIKAAANIDPSKINRQTMMWEKRGEISFIHPSQIIGHGLFESIQSYFDTYTQVQSNARSYGTLTTGAVANQGTGIATHNQYGILRRAWLPFFLLKIGLYDHTADDYRFFTGFTDRTTSLIPSSDSPILGTEACFLFGFRTTDTKIHIIHNDGSGGTVTYTATAVDVPTAITTYSFYIVMTASDIQWFIYNSANTLLDSGTVNTNIPATTKNLNHQTLVYPTTTTSKTVQIYKADVRCLA